MNQDSKSTKSIEEWARERGLNLDKGNIADALSWEQDNLDFIESMEQTEFTNKNIKRKKLTIFALNYLLRERDRCKTCNYVFNSELVSEYCIRHCPNCGQALDWSEE